VPSGVIAKERADARLAPEMLLRGKGIEDDVVDGVVMTMIGHSSSSMLR